MNHLGPEECPLCWKFDCRCWQSAAQGIETRSAIDAKRRGPKGESPVRKANAPNLPPYPSTD